MFTKPGADEGRVAGVCLGNWRGGRNSGRSGRNQEHAAEGGGDGQSGDGQPQTDGDGGHGVGSFVEDAADALADRRAEGGNAGAQCAFAAPERVISELVPDAQRRPLFILLDGTWAEARKAFRKSPWLDRFPVLALSPQRVSRYQLRQSSHAHHLCTSEVAALCLEMAGDGPAAQALEATLEVFSERSLRSRFGQRA